MMTGRERVKAALTFNHPDRVPRDLWALKYVTFARKSEYQDVLNEFPMDTISADADYLPSDRGLPYYPEPGYYTDHWGCVWHVGEPGVIGEVKHPALPDWSGLAHFQPPWERLRGRKFDSVSRLYESTERFVFSEWTAAPFERMQFLRGTESLFMDMAYGTKEVRDLLQMVHEYNLEDIRQWSSADVDGIIFADDWGSNQNLLISPRMWRELFKPLYKEYVDLIHAGGKFAFYHSDGQISSIYGDLVEIGIDALNSQLFVMDIEELGRKYSGKITFWGELDRQHILPFGTPEDVQAAIQRLRKALWREDGGCIAQLEWGKNDPRENVQAAFQAWSDI